MSVDRFAEVVRSKVRSLFGDTSDLSEELVNSLCNLLYFAEKARSQNFGGLTDLQQIHPNKSKSQPVSMYAEHIDHLGRCLGAAPDLIKNLRMMGAKDPGVFSYFEEVTVDIFKYKIEDVENKSAFRRHAERKLKKPSEHEGLVRKFEVPFRA